MDECNGIEEMRTRKSSRIIGSGPMHRAPEGTGSGKSGKVSKSTGEYPVGSSKFSRTFCWSGTTNGGEGLGDEFTITISGEKDRDGEGDLMEGTGE